jgi:hypothetical protein
MTLNSNEAQCFALVKENYDPAFLARMHESFPKIPGFSGWQVVKGEPDAADTREFDMRIGDKIVSSNRVERAPNSLVLWTVRLAPADGLSPEDASILADIEQCAALVILGFAP